MKGNVSVHNVLQYLGRQILSESDRTLLSMAMAPSVSEETLTEFLQDWDIETAPIQSVILLSYLMKTHPELPFPERIQPRLKGVLSFCRFQSLKLTSHFAKIARGLNTEEIPFVILKGGAMKVCRPDVPRWMGDIDILVEEKDFTRAEALAEKMGYTPFRCSHSTDLRIGGTEESAVDLHRFIQMRTGKEKALNPGLFRRARKEKMFSTEGYLPCREDMVFISLVNLYKNLSDKTSTDSVLNTFFDLDYLLHLPGEFDWEILHENAKKTGSEIQLWLAASLVSTLVPGLFPESFQTGRMDGGEAQAHCIRLLYRREILSPLRAKIGEFNLVKAFRNVRPLAPYIGHRAEFFFLKRVRGVSSEAKLLQKRGITKDWE